VPNHQLPIRWANIDSFISNSKAPELTHHRPCPICNSLKSKVVLELTDFQFYSDSAQLPKRVDVRETICLDCFALYLNPCYSNYGFGVLFAEAGQSYGSTARRPQEQIEWMTKRGLLSKNVTVLDVGCYEGTFLAHLPSSVKKIGVDIDHPAIERGRTRFQEHNIQFVVGDFENFQYEEEPPDTITMFHVLEHLPRPLSVLKKLRAISHSETKLIVEVPILENGATNDINGFFSVQHMTHFSRSSLRNCLDAAGWNIDEQDEKQDYNGCRALAFAADPNQNKESPEGNPDDWSVLQRYLSVWHASVLSAERKIQSMPASEFVVIWGGGAHTEFLYQVTTAFQARRICKFTIVDSDPLKHGKTWRGIQIQPPSILAGFDWSSAVLLISSYGGQESIAAAAAQMNVPTNRIIRVYDHIRRY
jgi:SAM-dependent methyltransferase